MSNEDQKNLRDLKTMSNFAILSKGARLYDRLIIEPMNGRKKEIILKRTGFSISSDLEMQVSGTKIYLPRLKDEALEFSLELCYFGGTISEKNSRYLLRSLSSHPFKLNGQYSFESFIERDDRVLLGYNRLTFKKSEEQRALEYEDHILKNEKLMNSNLHILLEGETGIGKSRLAKMIHKKSKRVGEFVHLNISSFSPNIVESELFGHIKGAFTGAQNNKMGAIALSNNGTLFLDEIDSLPLDLQTKLLLFLDSKEFRPVGALRPVKVDVRIIFASGRKLLDLVSSNDFRKDLYFRVSSGASFYLDPLRKRKEFIGKVCRDFCEKNEMSICPEAIQFYKRCPWPGNTRQLLGHLEKKMYLTNGKKIIYDKYDDELISIEINEDQRKLFKPLECIKNEYSNKVLNHFDGNIKKAAEILDITPNTLRKFSRQKLVSNY